MEPEISLLCSQATATGPWHVLVEFSPHPQTLFRIHFNTISAEVKKAWIYTSTPPYVFMALSLIKHKVRLRDVLIKHSDKFTFHLYLCSTPKFPKWSLIFRFSYWNFYVHLSSAHIRAIRPLDVITLIIYGKGKVVPVL
jgi:hypothetical protein